MVSAPSPDKGLPAGIAIQPLARFAAQAWRNGGGTTRPLAGHANGGWRISLADVTRNGPYSRFPGVTRLSLIVSGAGVRLRDGDRTVVLPPGQPVAYEGDMAWAASLDDGPVVALNTMAAHGRFVARIVTLTDVHPDSTTVPTGVFALVLTLGGRCAWSAAEETSDGGNAHGTLDPADVLTRDAGGPPLRLAPLASARGKGLCAALVTIEPVHSLGNPKEPQGTCA
ncbi:HutD/Ves family protein [Paraburkholderia aromaticivorans]|uniref:HutD/Ves family protein n=1 Tax=Paraburkholderia aromaticivorans TaxID=2026199 RepID=UPI0038B76DA7